MKQLFFITALVLGSFMLKAQHVEFGVKGGLNVSNVLVSKSASNYDPRISAHAGGLMHIHLTKEFAIQPELVFSGQGYKTKSVNGVEETLRLNYLNLPVLVQYMFNSGFRLETGPQLGLLLSGKAKTTEADIKKSFKGVDFAWAFGAGYLLKSGLGFDARFNLGIPKINDNPTLAEQRNGVFQVGVFYQFKSMKH
ncbi:MAG: porin family protein [Ferruginibacter sp.]